MRIAPVVLVLFAAVEAAQAQSAVGSFAHLVSGGGWTTTFTIHNNGSTTAAVHLQFYSDNGSPLTLPMTFPQGGSPGSSAGVDNFLPPGQEWVIRTTGPITQATLPGWAQLYADGSVTGFAVFSYASGSNINEAVVPLETRNPAQFVVPFDDTGGYITGVAIANLSTQAASIPLTIRDDKATTIATDTLQVPAQGHTAIVIPSQYAGAANQRGTLQFDTPAGGQINVLGLNFNSTLNFSSLPPEGIGSAPGAAAVSVNGAPTISSVTPILPQQSQPITIAGSGFGTQAAYNGDSSFIEITDVTGNWNAGLSNSTGGNTVTLNVSSWTDSKIVLGGFGGDYGKFGYAIANGDKLQVKIWNAQTQTGPAIFPLVAGAATTAVPLSISTSSLLNGGVGVAYSQPLTAAGGTGGYVWTLSSGTLPSSLTLSQGGVISGTPSTAGTSSFTVQVADSSGSKATRSLSITIASSGPSPSPLACYALGSLSKLAFPAIEPGMSDTLTWGSTCKSVTISPGIGQVASSGSLDLRPTTTTQYILVFTSSDGSIYQETQTVKVVPPATITSLTATPSTITVGGSSVIAWTTANANYVSLSPGPAFQVPGFTLASNGSYTVNPTQTTTYTLTAVDLIDTRPYTGPGTYPLGANITKTVTVTIGSTTGGGGSGIPGANPGGGGGGGGAYTGPGSVVTPIWNTCILSYYEPTHYNWLAYKNSCSVALSVEGLWNNAPHGVGSFNIAANGIYLDVYSQSEVNSHGGETLFLCPVGKVPVDSTGAFIVNPSSTYWCK